MAGILVDYRHGSTALDIDFCMCELRVPRFLLTCYAALEWKHGFPLYHLPLLFALMMPAMVNLVAKGAATRAVGSRRCVETWGEIWQLGVVVPRGPFDNCAT
jgi:hypothetical protein